MYCSSCGAGIAQGLSYCNHCGAKLIGDKNESLAKSSEMRPASLLWGMVAALVFGIFTITLLLMAMKMVGLNVGQIMAFMMVSFMTLLLVEGMFIRQLFRRQRGAEEARDKLLSGQQTTKELEAAQARALPDAMPSVTEHTTRSFEPIYRERK